MNDKYMNLEAELYKQINKNDNIEKKYKIIFKQMKNKEKSLMEEIENLKEKIKDYEFDKGFVDFKNQNRMQNLNLFNKVTGENITNLEQLNFDNFNNNLNIDNNMLNKTMFNLPINQRNLLNNSNINIFNQSYNNQNNVFQTINNQNINNNLINNVNTRLNNMLINKNLEDSRDQSQKEALEEFKKLLTKIDEN